MDDDWDDNAYPDSGQGNPAYVSNGHDQGSVHSNDGGRRYNNPRGGERGRGRRNNDGGRFERGGRQDNFRPDGRGGRDNWRQGGGGRDNFRNGGEGGGGQRDYGRRDDHNGGGNGGFRNQPGRENNNFYDRNISEAMETLHLDSYDVPRIIGRGGSTIKDIEGQYRVRVNISKMIDDDGNKEVKISGRDNESVNEAKEKILSIIGGGTGSSMKSAHTQSNEPGEFKLIDWDNMEVKAMEYNKERFGHLPPVQKRFYKECEEVSNFTDSEVDAIRARNNDIKVQRNFCEDVNRDIPNPITKFEHCFHDYPEILAEFQKMGYKEPSPIQSQAWPVLLDGNDMIGIAQTGTGKTMAFIVPAMIHTENQTMPREERSGPTVCILAPTRELALQIKMEVAKFQFRGMRAVCIYGGASRKEQIDIVEKGVEIVIATPGRLNDLLESKVIDLTSVTYFVLDEADRMLDMGFEPQIQRVLVNIRPDRQTVMTSATWPAGVRRLAQQYMREPIQVVVGTLDLAAVSSVTQHVEYVKETDKFEYILDYIKNMQPHEKAIIFCGKKLRVDDLASELGMMGIDCSCIHGQRDQRDREQALIDIKSGRTRMLIATDVASRGIDIEDITHVINYDFPKNIEEYVHRVGRTGRAGRTGQSISYFNHGDIRNAEELVRILEDANQTVPAFLRRLMATLE